MQVVFAAYFHRLQNPWKYLMLVGVAFSSKGHLNHISVDRNAWAGAAFSFSPLHLFIE